MSQADAARITGDPFVVGGNSVLPTISRRGSFLALASVAVTIPAAALVPNDAPFWTALAEHRVLDAQVEAQVQKALPDWDRVHEIVRRAAPSRHISMQQVVLAKVSTPTALLEKLLALDGAVDFDTGHDAYPDFWACLVRDVKGMAA